MAMWRARDLGWLLGFAASLAACSGGEETGRTTTSMWMPTTAAGAAGTGARPGTPGTGGPSTGGPPSGIGVSNPVGTAPVVTMPGVMMTDPMTGKPVDTCEEGKFCEPKGPDGDCGSERLDTDIKMIQIPGN